MNELFVRISALATDTQKHKKEMERVINIDATFLFSFGFNSSWRLKPEWHELFPFESSVLLCFCGERTDR